MTGRRRRRDFLLLLGGAVAGFAGAFFAVPKSIWLSKRRLEVGKSDPDLEDEIVDVSALDPGQTIVVGWRNRTIYVTRRTPEMLAKIDPEDNRLSDPQSKYSDQPTAAQNYHRSIRKDIFVFDVLCTHLGCPVQKVNEGEIKRWPAAGYFCACHGAQFDFAGRVLRAMPAPLNLVVPPHHYRDESTLVIGRDA